MMCMVEVHAQERGHLQHNTNMARQGPQRRRCQLAGVPDPRGALQPTAEEFIARCRVRQALPQGITRLSMQHATEACTMRHTAAFQ